MATAVLDLRETNLALYREGKRRNVEGDEMSQFSAELLVVVVRPERHWPSLFMGRPWRFLVVRYFSPLHARLNCHGGSPQCVLIRVSEGFGLIHGGNGRRRSRRRMALAGRGRQRAGRARARVSKWEKGTLQA